MERGNTKKRLIVGLIVLVVGALLLMRNVGIFDSFISEYIFRWEMILIALGLINVFSHEGNGPGYLLLLIGGGLYLRNYIELPYGFNFWQIFVAFAFILAGIFILFKRKNPAYCNGPRRENKEGIDTIDEVAIFGGGDRTIVSDTFNGGKMLAIFGGSNFNLTRSKLAPGKNYFDVLVLFGGFKLIVPENWNVKVTAISIFGGFSDKHRVPAPEKPAADDPELIIKGFVIFGGGEIKSY